MTVVNIDFQKIKGPVDPLNIPLNFGSDAPPPPPPATATFIWSKPAPILRVTAEYSTNVSRPTVANTGVAWQPGVAKPIDSAVLWDGGIAKPVENRAPWQKALQMPNDIEVVSEKLTDASVQTAVPWQQGVQYDSLVRSLNKQLTERPVLSVIPWQQGAETPRSWGDSFIVLTETPRELYIPWQQGRPSTATKLMRFGKAATIRLLHSIPWGLARQPRGGMEPPFVPVNPGVYNPNLSLNFRCRCTFPDPLNVVLNFGVNPCPDQIFEVPVREVYFVVNNLSLKRVSDDVEVLVTSASVGIDSSSWCWSFSATLPYNQLEKVEPSILTGPVEVELDINGTTWRFLVEEYSQRKEFGRTGVSVKGRSITALLENPYAPVRSYSQTTAMQSVVLVEAELNRPGLATGFTLDWQLVDALGWLMPAGTWSYFDLTPIQVIQAIAQGAGGFVNSHPSDKQLLVLPEYPAAPWDWATTTPQLVIPKSIIKSQNLQWTEKPLYNGVHVVGENTGVSAFVKRFGTDGSFQAPTFVSPMISASAAARSKGIAILGAGGKQARVSIDMPMESNLGLVTPGMLIEVTNGGMGSEPAWRGVVKSTSVDAVWSEALTVTQSLELERHYGGL